MDAAEAQGLRGTLSTNPQHPQHLLHPQQPQAQHHRVAGQCESPMAASVSAGNVHSRGSAASTEAFSHAQSSAMSVTSSTAAFSALPSVLSMPSGAGFGPLLHEPPASLSYRGGGGGGMQQPMQQHPQQQQQQMQAAYHGGYNAAANAPHYPHLQAPHYPPPSAAAAAAAVDPAAISTMSAVRALSVKSTRVDRLGMSRTEYREHVRQVLTLNPSLLSSLGVQVNRAVPNPIATSAVAAMNTSRIAVGAVLAHQQQQQQQHMLHAQHARPPPPQRDSRTQRHPKPHMHAPAYDTQHYGDPGRFDHGMPSHAGFSRSAPQPHDYSQPPPQYAHQYSPPPFRDGQTAPGVGGPYSSGHGGNMGELDRAFELHLQQQPLQSIFDVAPPPQQQAVSSHLSALARP
jgi:hypothetical protein